MTTTRESSLALEGDRSAEELDPIRLLLALAAPVEMRALGEDPYGLDAYGSPAGDPGLFGPGSVIWRVHADLPTLLFGGHSSLLLQSLNPRVMAGVNDHSTMCDDLVPRLLRTARFVLWTTFGGTELAEAIIEEVRRVHAGVRGRSEDGLRYSASDPELLTYVHVAEVWSLLCAYQRYSGKPLLRSEKDRYLEESALVAEALGARNVPKSVAAVRPYWQEVAGELRVTKGSEAAFDLLDQPMSDHPFEVLTHRVLHAAALDLLPAFAKKLAGYSPPPPVTLAIRAAAHGAALVMRTTAGPAAIAEAAERRARSSPVGC
jgi:uncharacterized protein (DUF2236 family)